MISMNIPVFRRFRFSLSSMFLLPCFRYSAHHRRTAFGIGDGMVSCDLVSEEDSSAGFENDSQQDSISFFGLFDPPVLGFFSPSNDFGIESLDQSGRRHVRPQREV